MTTYPQAGSAWKKLSAIDLGLNYNIRQTSSISGATGGTLLKVDAFGAAPVTSIGVLKAAGDANQTAYLLDLNGVGSWQLGPGGAVAGDVSVTRTGTGTATVAGVLTMTSPVLITPSLGVAAATSINKVAITAPATGATLTIADGKTHVVSNSITLAGTDSTTMTFPSTSATIARTDAANTFTGTQTIAGLVAISAANGASTPNVTITSTTAASTGGIALNVNNFIGSFPLTSVGVLKAAGDAQPTAGLYDTNGNGALKLGVGGSTAADFTIAYGGAANATVTGTLTMPSPVVTGTASFSAANISTDTTTGLKIATATTQKLGFFNATPVVQQGATTDLGTTLSNLGLRASGTAYPITTSGAVTLTGAVAMNATTLATDTTTGLKIGTATTQKLGFWNVTPIVQPASANQAAVGTTAPAGGTGTAAGGWDTSAHRDTAITTINSCVTLVNQMRSDLVSAGLLKGSA